MKLLPEDPRLTAYALGEIEDEQERIAIEAAVTQSPELQAVVADIRAMGDLLGSSLGAEVLPELSEFEKAKMEAHAPVRRFPVWPIWTAVAAALAVAMIVLPKRAAVKEEYAYQADARKDAAVADAEYETRYRVLDVAIPPELMEGTPQPIKVPNLEPAPTQAPTLMVAESIRVNADRDRQKAGASMIRDDAEATSSLSAAPPVVAHLEKKAKNTRAAVVLSEADAYSNVVADDFIAADGALGALSMDSIVPKRQVLTPKPIPVSVPTSSNEAYAPIEESDFRSPLVAPLSTFSIDVDTASYANVRRFLNQGQLPPADAVRIEELVNYFPYADAAPTQSLDEGGAPFAVHMAQTIAPWNKSNHLLRVALKGYEMPWDERPASNLVFLIDVSGSMGDANKLPLVKEAMDLLVRRLDGRDRVAVVVYAGASGLALPSTTANNRETIQHAMDNLSAGGSTNGGAGIELAYKVAREHFIAGGNNRVILCTDGDFNVGQTNQGNLADIAEVAAEEGVSLTILGFGMGNYKDDMLEELSNKGKGSYAYVDSSKEARKVFLEDLTGNLFKIAKDVKIQVEFNPAHVKAYRLIGYENRRLQAEDFNNDKKKAGDIGPGHTVIALYEIIPVAVDRELPSVDALRYQQQAEIEALPMEVATVKLRYKEPDGAVSKLITKTVESDDLVVFDSASEDVRFAAIVAAFGMRLAGSEHVSALSYDVIESIAASALDKDPGGHRSEFVGLVRKARKLSSGSQPEPEVIRCGVE